MTDEELIDETKYRLGLRFDGQVAALIEVTKQTISDARAGRKRLPVVARFRLWDKLGYAYTRDAVLWIMGEAGERVKEADNARAAKKAADKGGIEES
jgi:hypothetical protein